MPKATTRTSANFSSGLSIVRLLIVSYFMALAIGLIPGTDFTVLAAPFMPWGVARVLTGAIVFGLSCLVLIGLQRRAAALLLAITLFWASYVTLLSAETLQYLGGFWRDLALIGALILTYSDRENATQNDVVAVLGYLPQNKTDAANAASYRSRLLPAIAMAKVRRGANRTSSKEQFVEDLNHVRAS